MGKWKKSAERGEFHFPVSLRLKKFGEDHKKRSNNGNGRGVGKPGRSQSKLFWKTLHPVSEIFYRNLFIYFYFLLND